MSIQPLSYRPPPTSDTGSLFDIGLKSPDNPFQTHESSPTTEGHLGLVIYPPNPLFDPIVISSQRPYSSYDEPGVPLALSLHTSSVICHCLFPPMEPEGKALVTSPAQCEVSTPHTVEEEEHQFPIERFPYTGNIPISVYRDFPTNYVTLGKLISGTPTPSSLYHNPVWASDAMPTIGPFIQNPTSQ